MIVVVGRKGKATNAALAYPDEKMRSTQRETMIMASVRDGILIIRRENSIVETTNIAGGIDGFSTDDPRPVERAACTPGFAARPAD